VSGRHRVVVVALVLLAVLAGVLLVGFAGRACPVETPAQPCTDAARNRVLVVTMAALTIGLAVTPFAFLGEVVARRRIVYRGAWLRAARRGVLAGLVVAALAGLRLGGALNVPIAIFVVIVAVVIEWLAGRLER
jgi:Flp pilus assembly protein CpaB